MTEPPPIACTLDASDYPLRLAEMASIGEDSLLGCVRANRRVVLRFRPGSRTRARLEAIVTAESRCCAFLGLTLSQDEEGLTLVIDTPAGGEAVLHEISAAFRGETPEAMSR